MGLDLTISMQTQAVQDSKGRDTYTVTELATVRHNIYDMFCEVSHELSEMSNGSSIVLGHDEVADILEGLENIQGYRYGTPQQDDTIDDAIATLKNILEEDAPYYMFHLWY